MILLAEFVNVRVLAEIAETGEKVFPPLYSLRKARKNHDYFRVDHRRKVFDVTVDPCPIYSMHGRGGKVALGFLYHELLFLNSDRVSYQWPAD
jgi:hypothetical protein